ncbi:MAG: hypothetical protein EP147_19680 [Subdoligranulum sp.]|nr:hypothetical protein [Subdoligranulum sp.]
MDAALLSCGEFKLLVPFTEEHARLLVKENIIIKRGGNEAAEIRYIHITKNSQGMEEIEVQGKFFVDRQAHFDNADHHEGHNTEHSIRHCEADLHERRSGAQYPEFQHIHDRRRHRKRADRLYFGAVRERPACGGNGGEGGEAGYSGSDKCPHGQAYLFRLRRARSYGGQYRRERALYLFAGVRQHRGTGIHEQR